MDSQTVRFWDVATGVPLTPPLEDPDATYRAVSRDFSRVLSVYAWGEVGVSDAASGIFLALVSVPGAALDSATFDPSDPDQILVMQAEADPVFWRTRPAVGADTGLSTLAVSSGERVFSIFGDGTVRSWDVHGRQSIVPGLDGTMINALAAEPSGRLLAGVVAGAAHVWDVRTGRAVVTLQSGDDWFMDIALTPDGSQLVTVASDGRVVRWDARTGEELGELAAPQENGGGQTHRVPRRITGRLGDAPGPEHGPRRHPRPACPRPVPA